jgi:polyphosphate kinase
MAEDMKKYINREISWLSFNERVLQEAMDPTVPLHEKLKFMGIYSSNLDEFFSVRVGTLKRMIDAGIKAKSLLGGTPKKIMKEVQRIVIVQRDLFEKTFSVIQNELQSHRIYFVNEKELNDEQTEFVHSYFEQEVRPRLVPIMLDQVDSFPYVKNQVIYLAVYLKNSQSGDVKYSLIELPANLLPRYIVIPGIGKNRYIMILDDVIRFALKEIFAIFDYDSVQAYTIKLTRDAELYIDDDVRKSFFEKISKSLKQREKGEPVRFVYDAKLPEDFLQFILKNNKMTGFNNLIPGGRYHNARDFMTFPNIENALPRYEKRPPLPHKDLIGQKSLFAALKKKDILLHYPYHSFSNMIDLLREAAIDPQVRSIKVTLYRVANKSSVINCLRNASRNGKSVSVLLELQARFDEEANIYWTQKLEEENIHMIQGVPGMKVHSKLCLISREENNKTAYYAYIGTGNFNESTARIYSDHALLTSEKKIASEVNKVFKFLDNNYKTYNYKHLLLSPFHMRKKLNKMINNEIRNAKAGLPAYIHAKLNSLVDRDTIDRLYTASQAGVKIEMIVRGICSLVPGVKGLSDNIKVISIVDKYLEHSRIYLFCNNGDEKMYISSADWMVRNLDNRVEVAAPIYDPDIKAELKHFMQVQFRDNCKARIINEKQDNKYRRTRSKVKYRAQEDFYTFLTDQASGEK